jgi:hypothetical protein
VYYANLTADSRFVFYMNCEFEDKVFSIVPEEFESLALEIFRFQAAHNQVYRSFIDALHIDPQNVNSVSSIPYLPISFFKSHPIATTDFTPELVFESSGTTSTVNSRHPVKNLAIYRNSFVNGFEHFYGPIADWCIIGLLPSYLERQHSSLVYMVDEMIRMSKSPESGFYLYDFARLAKVLETLEERGQKTLLIGVTFGLLDFSEQFRLPLKSTMIMETGGMKGRRRELTRDEVHDQLKESFEVPAIHAEYGMTELLSQAYSKGDGLFECSPYLRVLLREEDDPFSIASTPGMSGLINVIDLANIYSCSFIATDDIGRMHEHGRFEVLGRLDNSDLRGCSLMVG